MTISLFSTNNGVELFLNSFRDGANHAFNNDTSAERYNKQAADLAWGRTIRFFHKYLG